MGLDALNTVNDTHGTIEDGQTAVDLKAEVLVAGGVDEVDGLGACSGGKSGGRGPLEGDGSGLDGDALGAFELEEVCYRISLVDT